MNAGNELLRLTQLRKSYGSGFTLELDHFGLARGEFVALIGESGCGKSTLLDMLALMLRPDAAQEFTFRDHKGRQLQIMRQWQRRSDFRLAQLRRQSIGYVLQNGGLLPFLSARDNIALPARISGRTLDQTTLDQAIEQLGLSEVVKQKPRSLSGGQRQRVALLRALLHGPELVLADEPTAAIDFPRAQQMMALLASLARERGVAVVVATHQRALVEPHARRCYHFSVETVGAEKTRSRCAGDPQ